MRFCILIRGQAARHRGTSAIDGTSAIALLIPLPPLAAMERGDAGCCAAKLRTRQPHLVPLPAPWGGVHHAERKTSGIDTSCAIATHGPVWSGLWRLQILSVLAPTGRERGGGGGCAAPPPTAHGVFLKQARQPAHAFVDLLGRDRAEGQAHESLALRRLALVGVGEEGLARA